MSIYAELIEKAAPLLADGGSLDAAGINSVFEQKLGRGKWGELKKQIEEIDSDLRSLGSAWQVTGPIVEVGGVGEGPEVFSKAAAIVRQLVPWRKGPFKILGCPIDAEWRSDIKWDRLVQALDERGIGIGPAIEGKTVIDIGCNNGYYLFRLLEHRPRLALGIDPVERYLLQLLLAAVAAGRPAELAVLPLGVEDLAALSPSFQLMLCLGVTYHRRDPVEAIRQLRAVTAPGGLAVIESLVIPGEDLATLIPAGLPGAGAGRYAKMKNVYIIPTALQLADWIRQAGFIEVMIHKTVATTSDEQRTTAFSPGESLKDFLSQLDPTLTIEGYPAPRRVMITAEAPR